MSATFDRDAAREVLFNDARIEIDDQLDALAGCVRPDPPQVIDRAEVVQLVRAAEYNRGERDQIADEIVALVVPDSRFDTIRALHFDGGHGDCRECGFKWPCRTVRALDGNSETSS